MAKSPIPAKGQIVETVTQSRVLDAPEDGGAESPGAGGDPYDFLASLTQLQWENEYLLYIYRRFPQPANGAKQSYIAKITHAIDDDWLKANFGGGRYHMFLKKGSQRVREWDSADIPGKPKDPADASAGDAPGGSDLVQALRLVLEKASSNPQSATNEMMALAFKNALEIQRQSVPAPMSMGDMVAMMKNLRDMDGGGAARASETPEWIKQLTAALIPAGVALITKVLEPKDSIATITEISRAFTAMKGLGGQAESPDVGTTLLNNGPQLLSGLANILAELRKAEELRAAQARPALPAPPERPGRAIPPGEMPKQPTAAQPQEVPRNAKGEPSPEFIWGKIIEMCRAGDSGEFALNFLDSIDPESIKNLRSYNLSLQELVQILQQGAIHPLHVELAKEPNFPRFIKEFHDTLMAPLTPPVSAPPA